jgi:predicted nucleotidyltransferase
VNVVESCGVNPSPTGVEELKRVAQLVGSRGDRILAMILFDSRARGDYDESSDWDIAIISSTPYYVET